MTFLGVKVSYLQHKVTSPEVGNGPGEAGPAPHKPEEQGSLVVRELLHHLPEPIHQWRCGVHPFVGRHRLQQVQWNVWAAARLQVKNVSCTETKENKYRYILVNATHEYSIICLIQILSTTCMWSLVILPWFPILALWTMTREALEWPLTCPLWPTWPDHQTHATCKTNSYMYTGTLYFLLAQYQRNSGQIYCVDQSA